MLRREIDHGAIRASCPRSSAFDDTALISVFAQSGRGAFMGPTVLEAEIMQQYQVQVFGRIDAIQESYYAISVERRISHPAVLSLLRSSPDCRLSESRPP